MDYIFKDIRNTTFDFSKKIIDNKYTQSVNQILDVDNTKYFNSIFELILSIKDFNYEIINKEETLDYVKTQILNLCNIVDSDYNNYNLNKKLLSKNTICNNLQLNKDTLSLILFYNEYYKINLIIFNKSNSLFYKTGLKDYEKVYISYHDKKWFITSSEDVEDPGEYSDISELKNIVDIDIKHNFIYNAFLKAISNYKAEELITIANECEIGLLKTNGKKKNKRDLYDEINLFKL
tara:strand:+ start:41 stop:745 length:705 start_codon:yes stop_codon:yes gene_type:complete